MFKMMLGCGSVYCNEADDAPRIGKGGSGNESLIALRRITPSRNTGHV